MKKRFLSLALALGLCLTLLTVPAAAAETEYFPAAFQGDGYYITATPYEIQDEGWYLSGKLAFHEGLVMVYQDAQEMDSQGYYTGQTYQRVGYADKTGIPYVVFLGEDEIARGVVSVKDMASGQQQTLPQAQAIALIQSGIATRANAAPIREPERS